MSEYVAYLNGKWVDSDELKIDRRDRGFRTGDVVGQAQRYGQMSNIGHPDAPQ